MLRTIRAGVAAAALVVSPALAAEQAIEIEVGGITANGHLVTAENKSLADGIVLMVHGTLAHGRMEIMRALQSGLSERGLNSLAITLTLGLDQRTGMYDCAKPHRHRHADAVDEIAAWIRWLEDAGAGPISLLGHSRGGNQAAWYAAERRDAAIERLILVAPMRWDADAEAAAYRKRYGKNLDDVLKQATLLAEAGKRRHEMAGVDFIYCPAARVTAEAFLGYYAPEPRRDTPTLLARITRPTLVIAAGNDQVVTGLPEAVRPLADGKRVGLVVIEDSDHMFLDFSADEAAEAIAAFVGN